MADEVSPVKEQGDGNGMDIDVWLALKEVAGPVKRVSRPELELRCLKNKEVSG